MLKRIFSIVVVIFGAVAVFGATSKLLCEGDRAPNFMLRNMDGAMVSLNHLCGKRVSLKKRKVVVLDFFQVTCKPCIEELPAIKRFYEAWKDDDRVLFYMVGVGETVERLKKFREEHDAHQLPMLCDPYLVCSRGFGVKSFPVAMIIDRNQVIRLVLENKQPKIDEILTERLLKLLQVTD